LEKKDVNIFSPSKGKHQPHLKMGKAIRILSHAKSARQPLLEGSRVDERFREGQEKGILCAGERGIGDSGQ